MIADQGLIVFGTTLFLLGMAHFNTRIALFDAQAFRYLHKRLRRFVPLFRVFWHLGRTPLSLVTLLLIALFQLQAGVLSGIVYALTVTVEWALKRSLQRPRPFYLLPDAQMEQPRRPDDFSFPSGDALRIWMLAALLTTLFDLPWPAALILYALAVIVSLGRIALGVHYPLDVLSGAGLGLLGAGLWHQLWHQAFISESITTLLALLAHL